MQRWIIEAEIASKLNQMRAVLAEAGASALRLRGTDWFAWATAGGSNAVLLAAETGIAEVLVTATDAWILTDRIEAERLAAEEVPTGYRFAVSEWAEPHQRERHVAQVGGKRILSDRPRGEEGALPQALWQARTVLLPEEIDRYRRVGQRSGEAMAEALAAARPEWSELRLAAEGARSLWARGLEPALVLAAGAERLAHFRHPRPTAASLGAQAMLVFCARGDGLYANLTRFVTFGDGDPQPHDRVREVEAALLDASRPGRSLAELYALAADAYTRLGCPDEIRAHHQGGTTGYLARERIATPDADTVLTGSMAVAWNPSLPGAKVEDTFVLAPDGTLENLTLIPDWPSTVVHGRARPLPWTGR